MGELRDNADDTVADMRRNGRQIKEDVQERADEAVEKTRKVVDDTVENAKEKGEELHGKAKQTWDRGANSADTAHHSSGEVVKKTAKHYEDNETVIDEKRTIVKK
jgi:ketosteroid isomerase-like protein